MFDQEKSEGVEQATEVAPETVEKTDETVAE